MRHAWPRLLRKSLPSTTLASMHFAVFGLGDSGYTAYNVVAKKLDRRIEQLGGQRLVPKGLGDDQVRARFVSVTLQAVRFVFVLLLRYTSCSTACMPNKMRL
jgi:sulfite reductase alpha subunit-like flavoprotein